MGIIQFYAANRPIDWVNGECASLRPMEWTFELAGQPLSALEIVGALSGILGVWLTSRRNIACFPIGLLNVTVYAVIFFSPSVRLYADGILQLVFGGLLVYGWREWSSAKEEKQVHITYLTRTAWLFVVIATSAMALLLGRILYNYTDAAIPQLDAALTAASLAAQWMVARRKIENWLFWIIIDLIYVPVYWQRALPLTALLYFIFLVLAVFGYRSWKRQMTEAYSPTPSN